MNSVGAYEVRTRLLYTSRIGTVFLLLIDASIWLQRPDIVDFHHRVQPIPGAFVQDIYDFVVIGAGSAGAVMAARLSEICHWDVLLLEAGTDETFLTELPFLYPTLQTSRVDWKFRTEPSQAFCLAMDDNRCRWPRGKALGGSSTINAMLYVRGNRRDFDGWRDLGNPGWSYEDMLPYFLKLEDMRDPEYSNRSYHGTGGPITVERFRYETSLQKHLLEGLREMGLTNRYGEVNGPVQSGFAVPHGSIRDGLRCSTAKGYLRPAASRKNLHISINTMVEKILIDPHDKRAYGVQFEKGNRRFYVMVSKEVILSAGALNSPHLLMLSGVGPRAHLEKHNIRVVQDLPGVGQNLQDHVATGAGGYTLQPPPGTGPVAYDFTQAIGVDTLRKFLLDHSGPLYGMPLCEVMGFLNTKYQDPSVDWPDIEVFLASLSDLTDGGRFGKRGSGVSDKYYGEVYERQLYQNSYMVIPMLSRPHSKGWLELASNRPRDHIRIHPNYFHDPRDMMVLIEGLRFAEALANTTAMRRINATLVDYSQSPCQRQPGGEDTFFDCLVRHYTQTIYHPCGTAKMGPATDPMAVVDRFLRVHRIGGLRVVDASIFPVITTGNTNVPTIATAEKAADIVKTAYLADLRAHAHELRECGTVQYDDYSAAAMKWNEVQKKKRGCCGSTKKRTIVGGWAWAWWLVTDVQRLSLEVMTLNPMCEMVETAQGVPLTVTGVAQCKIMKMMNVYYFHHQADELLGTASEQFLGKSVKEIKMTILQTLEGHLRAILGTLTVEEVYKDRDQFAALVREVAAPDVGRMGIEILSFTIKDVYDDVQYLQSLGKAQTASVKRDADAGVAEANRDAGIREAECEKSAMDVKYSTDTKIEDNARMYKLQKANFDQEINTAKAESQLAYELQAAKIRQRIRNEEIQIDIVERRKQIEIETQEINRKDCELSATVKLPAEAESYRVQTIAEGKRTQTVEVARAEAERIKKIGSAEAYAIEQVGKAEAERMRMKANVYKMYGDAAIMNIVLESLPKIAAEVAAPLAKTEEIVLIGGNDQTTGDVTRLVGQLPPAINALTGVDLSKVLGKIPGAKA